ncbi:hypothetical protein FB451DRAFT_1397005 [Mycena latifolia]|nr:hypothetical protein FB451DRAFT_1397005 [Mycena latifolia]
MPSSRVAGVHPAEISQLRRRVRLRYGQTGSGKSWTTGRGMGRGHLPSLVLPSFSLELEPSPALIHLTPSRRGGAGAELKDKGNTTRWRGRLSPPLSTISHTLTLRRLAVLTRAGAARSTTTRRRTTPPSRTRARPRSGGPRRCARCSRRRRRRGDAHSVFTPRIHGTHVGGVGALNLADLPVAGSERGSGRDVVAARRACALSELEGAAPLPLHTRFRGTTDVERLTYLLQNSLSGNSKTLMVLNLSPLAARLNESLMSLRFSTKIPRNSSSEITEHPVYNSVDEEFVCGVPESADDRDMLQLL